MPALVEYARLLKERHNVTVRAVAGCVISEDLVTETNAYNKEIEAEIDRRFGPGTLTKLWEEAEKNYNSQLTDLQRSTTQASQHAP